MARKKNTIAETSSTTVTTGGAVAPEEWDDRLAFVSEAMVRVRNTWEVVQRIVKKYGVSDSTARLWIKRVRDLRRSEVSAMDLENHRDDMRELLHKVVEMSLNKTQVVRDKDDNPVLNPQTGDVIVRPNPDLQRVIHAARELIHLDGLQRPLTGTIKVEHEVTAIPDLKTVDVTAQKAMTDFLTALAPGGDISQLAGDWFRFSGAEPTKERK
jgi:hypothetical protein